VTDARRRARPVVLAGPSGTGKTSIARQLVRDASEYVFSVSATTRPRREGEKEGVDYHFVSSEDFDRLIQNGELLEWAEVHGHRYGTPARSVRKSLAEGLRVVLDIDVQGARQVRATAPDAVRVFVLPPSAEALLGRLAGRGTEVRDDLIRRIRNARDELLEAPSFDHVVVNEDLDEAVLQVRSFIEGGGGDRPAGPVESVEAAVDRLRTEIQAALAAY
jgi:guanylate kinase